jgi:outer membrane receptor for ferrienterochelin and colicin
MRSRITGFILGIFISALVVSGARADVYGSVSGLVLDPQSHPVPGAVVMLEAPDSAPIHATTDKSGHFIFPRVSFDTYTITVEVSGYDQASETVTVSSGNVVAVTFHLSPKTIGKVVTKAGGVSVTGQPVSVSVLSARTIQTLPGNSTLAKVIETVPGVVPFSYGEPVFHGFHGVTYEVDGVPLPQTAGSNFSEIIDPRDINRLEVFTGSFPAEFGGQRQGGVVDLLTRRPSDIGGNSGTLSLYGGSYSNAGVSFNQSAGNGNFRAFVGANVFRNARGLDAPTPVAVHDNSNQSDGFARLLYSPNSRDTWAFDYGTQYAAFQIPINTNQHDPNDSNWSVPGTDDNQHEYARFANVSFSRLSADNQGYFQISPWWGSGRIQYLPDPANDLMGSSQSTLYQNRYANYLGVTASFLRSFGDNNLKTGVAASIENATSQFSFQFIDPTTGVLQPPFTDNVAQRGSNFGLYIEDKYYVSSAVTVNAGVRYDHSTGFTSGNQISPRVELNLQPDQLNIVHFYYGRLYAAPLLEDVRRSAVVFGGGSANAIPVYDLKPERDSIYEAGLLHTFTPMVSGSINLWERWVTDVLDTTQVGSTPLFTLFNSAQGEAYGMELRVQGHTYGGNNYYVSYGTSLSQAKGISGGTFLFPVSTLQGANSWALEDHDQTNTINTAYTWNLSSSGRYATLQTLFGSGFPVQFINGTARLPVHWEVGAAYGQPASKHGVGWEIDGNNLLNHVYLIKVNNGFNSTQYAQGRSVILKLTAPIQ